MDPVLGIPAYVDWYFLFGMLFSTIDVGVVTVALRSLLLLSFHLVPARKVFESFRLTLYQSLLARFQERHRDQKGGSENCWGRKAGANPDLEVP